MKANCVSLLFLSVRERELIKHSDKFHSISPFYHQASPDASLNGSTHPASPSPTVSHNRILIVDDDPDIATLFKITLERVGLAVDIFNDPVLALSSYKAGIYDLLLLDIRMPGMNGFELCQKIKNMDNEVKACFVTAYDEEYQKDLGILFPELKEADCFIRKPIESQKLTRIVKTKLANS